MYVRLDVDDAGDSIELALLESDPMEAQKIHNRIQENINLILSAMKRNESLKVLMVGCDDILFTISQNEYNLQFLESIKSEFKHKSGFSLSIGVGKSITECMLNLQLAKLSGKDKIIEKTISSNT